MHGNLNVSRVHLLILGLGGALALFAFSRTEFGASAIGNAVDAVARKARGDRNNNPGNIDWIADPKKRWRGMIRKETLEEGGRFGVFDTPANGVRAIAKELLVDVSRGVRTIEGFIGNWAPPNENDTAAYARFVASQVGIDSREPFDLVPNLPTVVKAIIRKELGYVPYSDIDLQKWVYLS